MKNIKHIILINLLMVSACLQSATAEWTFLTYIQADNNLWNYAYYNINDMQRGTINTPLVNVLVQWDQPTNKRTWRYKIVKDGRIEVVSLSSEMGIRPEQELVDCASWIKNSYPAKKYAWVLWNHGNGVKDKTVQIEAIEEKYKYSWIQLPGYQAPDRGILYDDSQRTYLSTQALYSTFSKISSILGQKIDLLGMDACLMAMIEIGYQIKDFAEIFVASQQTEPGDGWAYLPILNALTSNPGNVSALLLGQAIVAAYDKLYQQIREYDYTQSAINLSDLQAIKNNIDDVITKVAECKKYKSSDVKSSVVAARKQSVSFYISDYIDLHSFYSKLLLQIKALKAKKMSAKDVDQLNRRPIMKPRPRPTSKPTSTIIANVNAQAYLNALTVLESSLNSGLTLITAAVKANAVGKSDAGAKGISIYFPSSKSAITSTYKDTVFAQQSKWLQFITENR